MTIKLLKDITWNMSILYVEDDAQLLKSKEEILKQLFSHVKIFDNAKDAIIFYRQEKVDIVMTDINMPDMNGFEMIEIMQSTNKNQKFLVLSVYKKEDLTKKLKDLNIEHFLTKPISTTKLLEAIENLAIESLEIHS